MSKTALIILDLQQGILSMLQGVDVEAYVKRVAATAQRAREAGVQVIHVRTAFRPGYQDLSRRNKFLDLLAAMVGTSGQFTEGHISTEFDPAVAPLPQDLVITKKRGSAFSDTDLELMLKTLGVDALALAGVATSATVLSTLQQAADKDFVITAVEDLCLDRDVEVHRVLMEKVFPKQATVTSSSGWLDSLNSKE
ncbi:hypothetical protein FALCPG4_018106 [Fusarium falciforme]